MSQKQQSWTDLKVLDALRRPTISNIGYNNEGANFLRLEASCAEPPTHEVQLGLRVLREEHLRHLGDLVEGHADGFTLYNRDELAVGPSKGTVEVQILIRPISKPRSGPPNGKFFVLLTPQYAPSSTVPAEERLEPVCFGPLDMRSKNPVKDLRIVTSKRPNRAKAATKAKASRASGSAASGPASGAAGGGDGDSGDSVTGNKRTRGGRAIDRTSQSQSQAQTNALAPPSSGGGGRNKASKRSRARSPAQQADEETSDSEPSSSPVAGVVQQRQHKDHSATTDRQRAMASVPSSPSLSSFSSSTSTSSSSPFSSVSASAPAAAAGDEPIAPTVEVRATGTLFAGVLISQAQSGVIEALLDQEDDDSDDGDCEDEDKDHDEETEEVVDEEEAEAEAASAPTSTPATSPYSAAIPSSPSTVSLALSDLFGELDEDDDDDDDDGLPALGFGLPPFLNVTSAPGAVGGSAWASSRVLQLEHHIIALREVTAADSSFSSFLLPAGQGAVGIGIGALAGQHSGAARAQLCPLAALGPAYQGSFPLTSNADRLFPWTRGGRTNPHYHYHHDYE